MTGPILVVEDDVRVSTVIEAVVVEEGFPCLVARNTREADLVLETVPVLAMTLDPGLPGRDGLTWLAEIALARPELTARTVVISGRPLDRSESSVVERAGATVLPKPFPLNELRAWIRSRVMEDRDRGRQGPDEPRAVADPGPPDA